MDGAYRLEKMNEAREEVGGAPFLGSDDEIKESVLTGLCEELILDTDGSYLKARASAYEAKEAENARRRSNFLDRANERLEKGSFFLTKNVIPSNPFFYAAKSMSQKFLARSEWEDGEFFISTLNADESVLVLYLDNSEFVAGIKDVSIKLVNGVVLEGQKKLTDFDSWRLTFQPFAESSEIEELKNLVHEGNVKPYLSSLSFIVDSLRFTSDMVDIGGIDEINEDFKPISVTIPLTPDYFERSLEGSLDLQDIKKLLRDT